MKRLNTQVVCRIVTIVLLLGCFLGSHTAQASGYSGIADIKTIQTFNGLFYVRLDPAVAQNPDACSSFSGWYIFVGKELDAAQNGYKEYYATILSAFTLGKKINLYVGGCYSNYPKVQGITVSK